MVVHVKKSGEIEARMKQLFCLFVVTSALWLGCAGEKSPDRQRLYDDIWKQDSLDARSLMDSVKTLRMPDSARVDSPLAPNTPLRP